MKTLIFMKTHIIQDYVISEYKKLTNDLNQNEQSILFIDNHKKTLNIPEEPKIKNLNLNGQSIECFVCNKNINEELNIPSYSDKLDEKETGKTIWYNSDYPFYLIRKYYPDFDYYWSFEYDVFFNGKSYRPFFERHNSDDDLLVTNFRQIDNEYWYWNKGLSWIYTPETKFYASLFPVVRLSGKAIDFLYSRRLEHAKIYEQCKMDTKNKWIFCELFTATELPNNGFKCSSITGEKIRFMPLYNLNRERIFEHPDDILYHPVK